MIRAANLTQVTDYYKSNTVSKQNNTEKAKDVQPNAQKIKSSEDKLSSKAQKYLETLRKDNADFDFIIADKGDDFRNTYIKELCYFNQKTNIRHIDSCFPTRYSSTRYI